MPEGSWTAETIPSSTKGWKKKRVLLYAHSGLVDEDAALQPVAEYRAPLLQVEVYPVAFIWRTDAWTTLRNVLLDALSTRKSEGVIDAAKDFMLDRLDDMLEPVARLGGGKLLWDEMKENALAATTAADGGARLVARELAKLLASDPSIEIHVASHSAGSIFHAPLVQLLTAEGAIATGPLAGVNGLGLTIRTLTLWAPACTKALFEEMMLPAIRAKSVRRFALFTLTGSAEQEDDCAGLYHKSLLYLVSNAFEEKARIPLFRDGEPLLGMEKFVSADPTLKALFTPKTSEWVLAPTRPPPDPRVRRRPIITATSTTIARRSWRLWLASWQVRRRRARPSASADPLSA